MRYRYWYRYGWNSVTPPIGSASQRVQASTDGRHLIAESLGFCDGFCGASDEPLRVKDRHGQRRSLEREIEVTMELKKRFSEHVQPVGNVARFQYKNHRLKCLWGS